MRLTMLVFFTALFTLMALKAQPPTSAYNLRLVAEPGTTIGGQTLTEYTTIYRAALNDAGEIVFSAYLGDGNDGAAIFTSHRLVAKEGDVIDGKIIVTIPWDTGIAINNAGQVAYEAWYADTKDAAASRETSGEGVFVDDRLAVRLTSEAKEPFTLTDDGHVVFHREAKASAPPPAATAPPAQKKPGLLGRIRVNLPKLPKGFPVSIDPSTSKQQPARSATGLIERPPLSYPPLYMLPANKFGQVAIPANLYLGGFILWIATPVKH